MQLFGRLDVVQQSGFETADAVFGGNRSVKALDGVVNDRVDGFFMIETQATIEPLAHAHVVVQIAVAEVPENAGRDPVETALQSGVGCFDKVGQIITLNADVVLDVSAGVLVSAGNRFAHAPQRFALGFGLSQRRVRKRTVFKQVLENGQGGALQAFGLSRVVVFALDKNVPRRTQIKTDRDLRKFPGDHADRVNVHEFESAQLGAEMGVQCVEYVAGRRQAGKRKDINAAGDGQGAQFELSTGNDAEGSFGTDEKVFEIVPRVVFAQAAQHVEHASVGQDDFQTEALFAHVAVTNDMHAAGIRGQ